MINNILIRPGCGVTDWQVLTPTGIESHPNERKARRAAKRVIKQNKEKLRYIPSMKKEHHD